MMKPLVWEMVVEAISTLDDVVTYADIKRYIFSRWGKVNHEVITAQIIALTVNHNSRCHYLEDRKPRLTNCNSPYDKIFSLSPGKVTRYSVEEHGVWEIYILPNRRPGIKKFESVNC